MRFACVWTRGSRGHRFDQRTDAEERHHLLQIVSQHLEAHLGFHLGSVLVRKCVAPIQALMVPKGCSAVRRRMVMAFGMRSSRCCIASSTSSCFHRLIFSPRRKLTVNLTQDERRVFEMSGFDYAKAARREALLFVKWAGFILLGSLALLFVFADFASA